MHPRYRMAALLLILFTAGFPRVAAAERFEIAAGREGNLVRFDSKATVESFSGKTRQVEGFIEVTPASLGDSVAVRVTVDLASLDTGIDLRNQHMRKNHLETDKYPKAVFRGATIRPPHPSTLEPGERQSLEIEGDFELHGVSRRMRIPVEVTLTVEDGTPRLRVAGQFSVGLEDFGIKRPQFLVMRLSDVQRVVFDVTAVPAH
jgi:polyisoprenoid-binding protein YceI